MKFKVLFIGNGKFQDSLREIMPSDAEFSSWLATTEEEAINTLRREKPQLILFDFDCHTVAPVDFAEKYRQDFPPARLIGLAENASLSQAVAAVKFGFDDVIDRSTDAEKLQSEVAHLLAQWQKRQSGDDHHQQQKGKFDFSNILGDSHEMKQVLKIVSKLIRRKWVTVLIRGETGTGKELIARAIHYNSSTASRPFVEINCSTIPENLLEAELFGYEKGAFTDAKSRKKGLFEVANHGTLFLDEIGEISPSVQVRLLKALEEKKIRRLGGTEDIHIQTRIIAATHRDLQAAMREGEFREDLFYRLNVVKVQLPPLRERGRDVLLLARHFLHQFSQEYESPLREFSSDAEKLLVGYSWPGNVRELRHTIERLALLCEGEQISKSVLEEAIESETPIIMAKGDELLSVRIDIPPQGFCLDEAECKIVSTVLEEMGWNKRKTSHILKISRPRLDRIIKKYDLHQ